ncbi:hypothetical protein M5E89_06725 [Acidaminococcus intestini]|nr:hypothetical protein M5E89_06725 [Acidaminococcus intestini]
MPRYREKGSTDRKSFSEPESSITLDWSNRGTDTGLPRPTGISLIFNTPEITAKKLRSLPTKKETSGTIKASFMTRKMFHTAKSLQRESFSLKPMMTAST